MALLEFPQETTTLEAVPVCRQDQLDVDRGVAALVDGHQVAIFRLADGSIHAVDHHDPCSGVNVLARGLVGTADGQWYVASPLFKHRFALETGQCLDDPESSIGVHRATVTFGTVHIALGARS